MSEKKSSATVNYAIIGAGAMGREHISYLNMIDGVRVAAIADTNEEQRHLSCQLANGEIASFANASDLIAADMVDAYVLATPNFSHVNDLPQIFAANKPVLIDIPPGK